jgi:eukaryotic-like serine/threonine-protein kinase
MSSQAKTSMGSIDDELALIAEEFAERCRSADPPTIEEYAEKYPEHASRIRSLFPTMLTLEVAGVAADGEERLGEYRIVREVGRGGMGVVYEAVQESLGRRVALKILPPGIGRDGRAHERFRREARSAGRLHHANIVPVFGVGEARRQGLGASVHYYAMQFIDGVGLDELVRRVRTSRNLSSTALGCVSTFEHTAAPSEPPSGSTDASFPLLERRPVDELPPTVSEVMKSPRAEYYRTLARWGIQAAEALQHAHARGMLHRDVKPSNFLIDETGHLWLTDFGLAKAVEDAEITGAGDVVGTLRYMPPERLGGDASPASDVFSLGATLYECLTLQPVYPGEDRLQIVDQIQRCEVIPPRRLDSRLPVDLELVVMTALEKNPQERYRSAQEFADDLRRYLSGEPVRTVKSHRLYRFKKFVGRHKKVVGTATAMLVLLLAGICGTTWGLIKETEGRKAADAGRKAADEGRKAADAAKTEAKWAQARTLEALRESTEDVMERLIASKPTIGPTERAYIDSVLQRWRALAEEKGIGEEARRLRAEGYFRVGTLRGKLGETRDAQASYRDAITIREGLVRDFPSNREYLQELALTHLNAGTLHHNLGESEPAERHFAKALALLKPLAQADAPPPAVLDTLSRSYHHLGNVHFEAARYPEAMEQHKQAVAYARKLTTEFPKTARYRLTLARIQNDWGVKLRHRGNPDEALAPLREALDLKKSLGAEFANSPEYRIDLALGHNNLGTALIDVDKSAARKEFRQAITIQERLLSEYPSIPLYRLALGGSYCNYGRLEREDGNAEPSLDWFDKAVDTLTPLAGREPRLPGAIKYLFNTHWSRAEAYLQIGQPDDAYTDAERAFAYADPPGRTKVRRFQAQVAERLRDEDFLRKALTARQRSEPSEWTTFHLQSVLGKLLLVAGKHEDAEKQVATSYQGLKRLFATIPAEFKDGVDHTLLDLIDVTKALGKDATTMEQELAERKRERGKTR